MYSWLNDYLFTPLALLLRDYEKRGIYTALFITFLISGLWHGANWTFVIFGGLHGLPFLPFLKKKKKFTSISSLKKSKSQNNQLKEIPKMLLTFVIVTFTFIFFRSETVANAFEYINRITKGIGSFTSYIETLNYFYWRLKPGMIAILLLFFLIEWITQNEEFQLDFFNSKWNKKAKWTFYLILGFAVIFYRGNQQEFIYFQF